jgi:excisionase family DNA binding protein
MEAIASQPVVSPRLLSISSAAQFLGVSKWSIRGLLWDAEVPFIVVGRSHYIDRRDLEHWVDTHKERAGMGPITGTPRKARLKV